MDKLVNSAICGLFCKGCRAQIVSGCKGCRSPERLCGKCQFRDCIAKKGILFCSECGEYPCGLLVKFKQERPHRIEIFDNLEQIARVGYEAWFDGQTSRYACPDCGAMNSAYNKACVNCGRSPSCLYVEKHGPEIQAWSDTD